MRARRSTILAALALILPIGALTTAVALDLHHRTSERANRRALVRRLEAEVTSYARARVAAHKLPGPILRTRCHPFDVLNQDDLRVRQGRYSCIAVTFETPATYAGHIFIGVIDYGSGRIRFYRTGIPSWLGI